MQDWAPKRFWSAAGVVACDGGFTVHLDERPLRTPGRVPLVVPTEALALEIAAEWDAQDEVVDPTVMPMTRMANSAIDRIGAKRDEVIDYIAEYGATDLVCYRAESPEALAARQAAVWDPYLDWAHETLAARLLPTAGIMPVAQSTAALSALRDAVAAHDRFELMGLHDLVALTGSLVLGLAASRGHRAPGEIWADSRIDEVWQIEQWGEDEEAAQASEIKRLAFLDAHRFFISAQ